MKIRYRWVETIVPGQVFGRIVSAKDKGFSLFSKLVPVTCKQSGIKVVIVVLC